MIDRKFINKFIYITLPFVSIYIITIVLEKYDIFRLASGMLGVISPLIVAYILALIIKPAVDCVERKVHKRGLSVFIVLAVFCFFVLLFLKLLVPLVVTQVAEFIKVFPMIQQELITLSDELISSLDSIGIDSQASQLESLLEDQIANISQLVLDNVNNLSNIIGSMIAGIISSLFKTVLTITLFIYLLIDLEIINEKLVKLVPKKYRPEFVDTLAEIATATNEYFKSLFIIMVIVFVLNWVGLMIIGIPNSFVLAIIIAVTNLIPFVGPYIGAVPAILVALTVSFNAVIFVILMIIIIQQVDANALNPYFMRKSTHLHPVIIITGVIVFSYFMGIVGMLIAIPSLSIIKIIFSRINNKFNLINID